MKSSLIIYTPVISGSRHLYYNELTRFFDVTIVSDTNTSNFIVENFGLYEKLFDHHVLEGFRYKAYMTFNFKFFLFIKDFFKADYVILEQYATPTSVILAILFSIKKKNFYFSLDGGYKKNESKSMIRIKKNILSLSKEIMTTGNAADQYLKKYGYKYRIYNYPISSVNCSQIAIIDENKKIKEIFKNKLGLINRLTILFVGRICREKGIDFIERLIIDSSIEFNCVLIGDVEPNGYEYVERLSLNNNIHIIPFTSREKLLEFYAVADIFLSPSKFDTWNYTVCEALISSNIVVTSDNTGIANSIKHKYLLVYSNNDYYSFYEKVMDAIMLLPVREYEFDYIKKEYNIENMATKIAAILKKNG